jgi:Fur family ferric uptake transcriptional regulator
MSARVPANTPGELKRAGLKKTTPRVKILSLLERGAEKRHFTAEDVYRLLSDAGEDIGLGTIYRVLTQFENAGLVIRHNFEGGRSVFELNDEAHHDHMVCVACGAVFEFQDKVIEERQHAVARQAGFELDHHALYLYGVCEGVRRHGKCSMNEAPAGRRIRRKPA